MDIIMKSKLFPDSSLIILDLSKDPTNELLLAIEEAKREYPGVNLDNCEIEFKPATLTITR